jgi:hypothetical protein
MSTRKGATLPDGLLALVRTRRFWEHYFRDFDGREPDYDDSGYSALEDLTLRFEVAPGWNLILALDEHLIAFYLDLEGPSGETGTLGWDDEAHWHPHVLRWDELDLIARAVAARDPAAHHPGIPLLLLHRFAPVCNDDDARLAFPLLDEAWRALDLFRGRRLRRLLDRGDRRASGFVWTRENGRWTLHQTEKPDGYHLYTLRVSENDEFPFELLDGLLEAAEATARAAGMVRATAAAKVRPRTPRVPRNVDVPRLTSSYSLPGSAGKFFADRIDDMLRDFDLGTAESSGGGATHDPSGKLISASSNVRVTLEREIELAERLLAAALFWSRAPAATLLWSGNQRRPLSDSDPALTPLYLRAQRFEVSSAGARAGMEPLVHYVPEPLRPANATSSAIASKADRAPNDDGDQWLKFDDGGMLRIRPTGGGDALTGFGCVFEQLSLDACRFVLDLSRVDELLLAPLMLTASETLARTLAGVWPGTRYLGSADELLEILRQGPRVWWERHGPAVLADSRMK